MLAHFQSSGISPLSYDFLNMIVRMEATGSESSFITRGVIPSGPGALWILSWSNIRFISTLVIWMSSMVGKGDDIIGMSCASGLSRHT